MAIYWTTDGHGTVTPERSLANPGPAWLPRDAARPQENTRAERRQPIQPAQPVQPAQSQSQSMTRTTTARGVPFANLTTDTQKAIIWAVDRRVTTAARRP